MIDPRSKLSRHPQGAASYAAVLKRWQIHSKDIGLVDGSGVFILKKNCPNLNKDIFSNQMLETHKLPAATAKSYS